MLQLLLVLAPLFAIDTPQTPDAARIKAVVAELDKAFKDGGSPERVKAIQSGAQVVDAEVISAIAKALRDKDAEVEKAAIEALRFMDHPDSKKSLIEAAKHEPRIKKDLDLYASILRAIGQHGDAGSIEVLTEDIWTTIDADVTRARILGLGRIRTKAAVEKLFDLMRAAGPHKIQPHMDQFRVSLMVLTGVDQGTTPENWLKWWNDTKGKFEVAPKAAALPKELQYAWDVYWGEKRGDDRPKKRGDRGKDDPSK